MADFKIKSNAEQLRTIPCTTALATVIEAGDMVAIDTGLIIKAVAASTKIAFAPNGADASETVVDVSVGNDFVLVGTADANFAVAQKGTEVDLVGTTTQLIDVGESTTDVFLVSIREDAGTVGSTADVQVRINYGKALF